MYLNKNWKEHNERLKPSPHSFLKFLLAFFLFLEFVRPPGLVQLKLQLVIIVFISILFLFSKDKPWTGILLAQLLFLLIIIKSLPFAANGFTVYRISNAMYGYVAISFGLAWIMSWRANYNYLSWVWVLILLYNALYGITHGGKGPGGYIGDENDLALSACVGLPIALYNFEFRKGWIKVVSIGMVFIFVMAIIASFSRGGFIGFLAIVIFYFTYSGNKIKKIFLVLFAAIAFMVLAPQEYLDEMNTIQSDSKAESGADSTGNQRFYQWATAYNAFKENPIMGIGAGNFMWTAGRYQPKTGNWPEQFFRRSLSGTQIHSFYFKLLSELALPGVLLFIYILWRSYKIITKARKIVKENKNIAVDVAQQINSFSMALAASMIGFLFSAIFLAVLYYPYFWYLSGMAVALEILVQREVDNAEKSAEDDVINDNVIKDKGLA